jgi:hypothetical protein
MACHDFSSSLAASGPGADSRGRFALHPDGLDPRPAPRFLDVEMMAHQEASFVDAVPENSHSDLSVNEYLIR